MEELINRMIGILNRYSIEDVNKLYRDKEVELEITSFSKHPEVKWSELLKKKMIQAAKRKRIAPGNDLLSSLFYCQSLTPLRAATR